MTTSTDSETMQPGFVALLDVLGFESLISGGAQPGRLRAYLRCLEDSLKPDPSISEIDFVVFSDTIVLTTRNDDELSFQALLRRCSMLFGAMLEMEIPLRGAIAYGSYYRRNVAGGVFLAGTAIIDAHNFEKQQDWVGIMVSPSAVRKVATLPDLCALPRDYTPEELDLFKQRLPWAAFVQECHVPFKTASPFDDKQFMSFAIIPGRGRSDHAAVEQSLSKSIEELKWMRLLAPTPAAQSKYTKAADWMEAVKSAWNQPTRALSNLLASRETC